MRVEVKIKEESKWADIFVEDKYVGYIFSNEKGELFVYIYKKNVTEVSVS